MRTKMNIIFQSLCCFKISLNEKTILVIKTVFNHLNDFVMGIFLDKTEGVCSSVHGTHKAWKTL